MQRPADQLRRVAAVAGKEVRQLRRDRLTFGMIIGVPLLQILLFGYAINFDVRDIRTGVVDYANTSESRRLVSAAEATQIAKVVRIASSPSELESLLEVGDIDLAIVIPHDFDRRVADRRPAAQLLINGSDPTLEGIARRLAQMPFGDDAAPIVRVFEARTYYNPERRTALQIVPALTGVILHLTMVLFTAIAIVRERERGNLELLITTPVRTVELMVGKILPYVVIGLIQASIVLLVGAWLFDVVVRGSVFDFYLASLAFIMASLVLGLLISTIARTQFQAFQLMVFTFLPSMLLSGFMFPFDGMPRVAQWLGELLPLTHFVRLARGIVVRGASIGDLGTDVGALLAFFIVFLVVAVLRFHKRLD
ncbi:MAG: ABC transporter permease [Gammaproteobacteria bacterium]